MNYLGISKCSIADGPGVRVVLWVSGCNIHCDNCHNPESWDFNAGKLFDNSAKEELFNALSKPWVQGLTLSGGHPLEYENLPVVYDIVKEAKEKFPNKDIWLYTGYTLSINDFNTSVDVGWDNGLLRNYILAMCDTVVDGPYIESLRDISLKFRGSSNQRLIDVRETIKQNCIILLK
jgi:anaerobic ribonucleoside-triphosphate reductase activating protein